MTLIDRRSAFGASVFTGLGERVILAAGWSRAAMAFVAGAVQALTLSPLGLWPAAFVSLTLAVWLIDGAAGAAQAPTRRAILKSAAIAGWFWGFGYFLAGLWWLGAAFLVEADKFAWALPLGVIAVPAGLALFPALGFALARLVWSGGGARIFALAAGLGLSEWLRCNLLTGFPWNEIGMVLGRDLIFAQIASLVGLHGLTLLGVMIFAAPATLIDSRQRPWTRHPATFALAALALIALFGFLRLSGPAAPDVAGVKLRLVQPDMAEDSTFRASNKDAIMRRYLTLSDRATSPTSSGVADVTHLIWPESSFPFLLAREPQALAAIADLLHGGATLITGAARMAEPIPGDREPHFFNSIQVVDRSGALLDHYDKRHLVPFGEYLPFGGLLTRLGLTQFVDLPGGFEPGAAKQSLHIPGLPDVEPLVCYEAIFPIEFGGTAFGGKRAQWLLNLTNDGWFGATPGPYQHLAQARLRAIETGLPLVRDANSGISAVTDGLGRIVAQTPLGVDGVIDSALPQAQPETLFSRYGLCVPALLWLLALAAALIGRRRA